MEKMQQKQLENKRVKYTRGKKLPPNTKLVNRTSRWGNPKRLEDYPTREELLFAYEIWIIEQLGKDQTFVDPLIGFDLACDCELDLICHADILLKAVKGYYQFDKDGNPKKKEDVKHKHWFHRTKGFCLICQEKEK